MSEQAIQSAIMLAIGRGLSRVFRNNIGTAFHKDGSAVKYGICNPGGSDLIGWKSVEITPDMVGKTVAVFLAIECKNTKKRVQPGSDQEKFINMVRKAGGLAGDARSVDEARAIVDGM